MKRNLILAGITLLLLGIGLLGCFLLLHKEQGTVAVITQNGREIHRIDLSRVEESYTIILTNAEGGENCILVEPGSISMQAASCPDHLCIQTGAISQSGLPVVCLPNHIIIEIQGAASGDTDVRVY